MNFSWEFNPAVMLALAGGAFTVIRFWLYSGRKAEDALDAARAAMVEAKNAHEKIALLNAAMNAHQITQAERLVSREVLREVEGRLAGAIDNLGDRMDNTVRDIIKSLAAR